MTYEFSSYKIRQIQGLEDAFDSLFLHLALEVILGKISECVDCVDVVNTESFFTDIHNSLKF